MRDTTQITYGDGIVSVELTSDSTSDIPAPAIRFGDYEQLLESCFTRKELDEIYRGDHASLTFSFVMSDDPKEIDEYETISTAVRRASKSLGKLNEGFALKMKAVKSVGSGEELPLDNLIRNVELQIEIPLYLAREDRDYYLITDSLGACKIYEDYDVDADTLSVNTGTVGTSMLLYMETFRESPVADTGKDGIKPQYVFCGLIIALLALWQYITGIRRHKLKEQR